jgi:transposase-like protein
MSNQKLTDEQKEIIMTSSKKGYLLAKEFGVDPATISRIRTKNNYNLETDSIEKPIEVKPEEIPMPDKNSFFSKRLV